MPERCMEFALDTLVSFFAEDKDLNFVQMGFRAAVIFFIALILVRIAGRRTFGLHAPLDNIVVLLLGAILARPIVGASPFLETIFAALILVMLHRLFALIAVNSPALGRLLKGSKTILYRDGQFIEGNMNYVGVSEDDIYEELRFELKQDSLDNIATVYMEKTGTISFVEKARRQNS
jgi:uncharacterized membrane protein YcaP (DUF421 family)